MKATKIAFVGLAVVLAGCGTQLQKTEGLQASGDEFSKELFDGYLGLARSEYAEADYSDSDFFAARAQTVAADGAIGPQAIEARNLPTDRVPVLTGARDRLVAALADGAREKAASDVADAQVAFDCWMQEQEENFQPADIAACQQNFTLAMAKVDEALKPAPEPVQVAAAPQPAPPPRDFVVLFDFDDSELTDEAVAKLEEVASYAAQFERASLEIKGHTDRAGSNDYNDSLAKLRAAIVLDGLRKAGVDNAKVDVLGLGETLPAVATADGVAEPKNRRVTIRISE